MGATSASQLAAEESQPLSSLEAAHVESVLQTAIDKLALMSVIATDPGTQAQELTKTVGEEIGRMLRRQKQLEQRFHQLIAAQPALRAMANKANLHHNQAELQEVSEALRQATKQLCRNLQDTPNISANMAKVAAQRETLQVLLSNTLDCLEQHGTVQPIVEAVLGAEGAEAHMRELVEAERSATALVKSLRADLVTEREHHDQHALEQRRDLQVLKSQLQQEKLQLAVEASNHAKDLAASNQTTRRLQAADLERMQQELALLQQQLGIEASVRAAAVSFLASRASSHQESAVAWHARREEDAQDKDRDVEALRAAHNKALEVLAEAEGRLREEAAAKEARDAKAREEAEERAAEAALAARRLAATITIQAAWRGYKARLAKGDGARPNSKKASGKPSKRKGATK